MDFMIIFPLNVNHDVNHGELMLHYYLHFKALRGDEGRLFQQFFDEEFVLLNMQQAIITIFLSIWAYLHCVSLPVLR